MIPQPVRYGEQLRPDVDKFEGLEWAFLQPREEFRPGFFSEVEDATELLRRFASTDDTQRMVHGVDPDFRGNGVGAENAVIDGLPFDSVGSSPFRKLGDPFAYLIESLAEFARVGSF